MNSWAERVVHDTAHGETVSEWTTLGTVMVATARVLVDLLEREAERDRREELREEREWERRHDYA